MATQDDTTFTYDDVSGQVTKETTKLTKNKDVVKNYTYDSAGNKSAFAVKVGDDTKLSLQYTYDGASKLTAVTDEDGKVVDYSYDTDGNLSERTVAGNGMTTTYAYDYQNRLTSLKNQTGKGVISEYDSEYLVNGQKTKETATVQDQNGKKSTKTSAYTYDLLGRITKEKKTGSEDISYTYDSNNNRKEMTVGNKVTAYRYNKNDELLRTDTLNTDTEEDSIVIYKNDKNGNQLATVNRYGIPSDKKDSSYVDIDVTLGDNRLNENVVNHYNALNQLTQTLTKNYKVSFTYDAEGLRTSKTVNGEKTFFVWDGDQLVMELSESGRVQKRYIRGNDRGYGSNLVYSDKGENTEKQYYVTDPHGNVVQLTDGSGKVTKTYEYDSFGNEVNPDSKDENPFRYCGEYYDKETEEIYLRARYYEPNVGRFLTRDTYTGEDDEPESLHLYTYCENDGVNAVDPSGHDAIWLNSSESASGFGHSAVLIKNTHNKWDYLTYTGQKGLTKKTLDYYYSFANSSTLLKIINQKYRRGKDMGPYNGLVYFKGKFKSVKNSTIKNSKKKQGKYSKEKYNVLSHNCLDMTVDFLSKGVYEKYNHEYHVALGYANAMSVPNNAFASMKYFVDTIDDYMKANWVMRLFINPYRVFNNFVQRSVIV